MLLTHGLNKDKGELYYHFADINSGVSGSVITFLIPNYDFFGRHGRIVGHISDKDLDKDLTDVEYSYNQNYYGIMRK